MADNRPSLIREATDAGILGALAVAAWFFLLDVLEGQPLRTPSVLGQVLLLGQATPVTDRVLFGAVMVYTPVHFGAFVVFAFGVTKLVHLAIKETAFLFALMIVFVVFEAAFFMVTYVFFTETAGLFPWWSVLVANTLAAVAMGAYYWRAHPELVQDLARQPLGDVAGPPHPPA